MGNGYKFQPASSPPLQCISNPDITEGKRRERPNGSWPPLAAACVGSDAKALSTRRMTTGWRREIAMGAGGRRPREQERGTEGGGGWPGEERPSEAASAPVGRRPGHGQ